MSLIHGERIIVRGAGDLATGCIVRLVRAGFRVAALEIPKPSSIRRTVCLSEAMYEGTAEVEGIQAIRVASVGELKKLLDDPSAQRRVPILEDPECAVLSELRPLALVDAIIAKRNLGTRKGMAPVVIALGPGFEAGIDADAVVETNRGHDLGRVILEGRAEENTGVPGIIGGKGQERVMHAPRPGLIEGLRCIGDSVRAGEPVLAIQDGAERLEMVSPLDGVLRGLIRSGYQAHAGMKLADVDPRGLRAHCFTISDKAMAIAGGVLEGILMLGRRTS